MATSVSTRRRSNPLPKGLASVSNSRKSPDDTQARRDLANARDSQASRSNVSAGIDEAIAPFEKSRDLRKSLANSDPEISNGERSRRRLRALRRRAILKAISAAALEQYHAALAIRERLAAADVDNAVWQTDLVLDLRRLALVGDEPRSRLTKALDVARRLQSSGNLPADKAGLVADLEKRQRSQTLTCRLSTALTIYVDVLLCRPAILK